MIKVKNLTKYYGDFCAINDLSFEVNSGEIFGFIGPNGAGKSTTIRCIMNMLNYKGTITINNNVINKNEYEYKKDIGYLPSEIFLYEGLTVKELLEYNDIFYKDKRKDIDEIIKRLNLPINKRIEELSFGNLKKVGIILALINDPKILIFDEPTSGLDPLIQEEFYKILKEEKKKGKTIFFSSHNLNEVKKVCDRVAIIKEGKIIEISNINKLMSANYIEIKIFSKEINKIKNLKSIKIKDIDESSISFIYYGNANDLIKNLSDINIDKILIEEPSIDEIFMHFYK